MKYIIELNPDCVDGNFLRMPIRLAGEDQWIKTKASLMPYTEPDISGIENEVWELADYMGRMSLTERDLCFGFPLPQEVTMNLSYNEAKDKFEAWLKQKDEIHVGDEVVFEMAFGNGLDNNMKAVVLDQAAKGEEWCVLTENGLST